MRYVHTNLVARDWRKLAKFYTEVFGCELVPPERYLSGDWLSRGTHVDDATLEGAHLRLPGHGPDGPTLEIFTYRRIESRLSTAANRLGYGHLAFEVEDVAAEVERVVAHGGTRLGEVVQQRVPGRGTLTFTYVCDPEGNLIELQRWA